jgi:transcriptional regulator with XRE-family HTH domain
MWATRPFDWGMLARDRRVALGLSQAEVAKACDTTRQWVVRFESGMATAASRLGLALRIMDYLGLIVQITPEKLKEDRWRDG